MTKQEQIEEMAKIICGRVKDDICIIDGTSCDSCCNWARQAEKIYNAGYRKVDDLETENKQLKTECALLDNELRIARQDTINVLNELWEKVKDEGVDYKIGMRALSEEIDELIKEQLKK